MSNQDLFHHETIRANGLNFHCVVAGEGRPVLLLHGFPEFWFEWRNMLPALAEAGFRAIAPDLRGYNLSDKPDLIDDYKMKHLVADVAGLIDHYSSDGRAFVVGHDWGGVVAWALAISKPEKVDKLVIVNAPHPGTMRRELALNENQQQASRYIHYFRRTDAEAGLTENDFLRLRRMIFLTASGPETFPADVQDEYVKAWSQPGAVEGGLNYYRASQIFPDISAEESKSRAIEFADNLRVTVPTLVIWGEKDQALLTGNLDGLDRYVADLKVIRVPDGTHWVIHEHPALIASYIKTFLQ